MATVMIVDDLEMFRTVVAHALRGAGHQTVCAPDGAAALRLLETAAADVILLDLAMPNMNGLEFLQRLRGSPRFGKTPVIIVSALSSSQQLDSVAKLGVSGHLLKSRFSLRELVQCVNDVVARTTGASQSPGAGAAA